MPVGVRNSFKPSTATPYLDPIPDSKKGQRHQPAPPKFLTPDHDQTLTVKKGKKIVKSPKKKGKSIKKQASTIKHHCKLCPKKFKSQQALGGHTSKAHPG